MIIIMLGAQASGKGTVGAKLAEALSIPHISTGDIFRENIQRGTELGKEANKYILKGELVPDDLTNKIVADRFLRDDVKNGAILDGYPRTKKQCEELDKILESQGKSVDLVINLDVPYEELIKRIETRRVCAKCKEGYNIVFNPTKVEGICNKCGGNVVQREDDKPDAIRERLNIYYSNAEIITNYYKLQGKLRNEVAGDNIGRTSNDVVADLVKDLK